MLSVVTRNGFPGADVEKIFKAPFNAKIRKKRKKFTDVTAGDEIFLPVFTKKDLRPVHSLLLDMAFAADADLNITEELLRSVEADLKEAQARKKNALNNTAELSVLYIKESRKLDEALRKCKRETSKLSLDNLLGRCMSDYERSSKSVEKSRNSFAKIIKEEELKANSLISALTETKKVLGSQVTAKAALRSTLSGIVDDLNDLSRQTF